MNKPKYLYKSEELLMIYEFVSEGPKGRIKKIVQYTDTGTENVYNLAFGDYDEKTKNIDDISITNNGDCTKVFATLLQLFMLLLKNIPMPGFLPQAVL